MGAGVAGALRVAFGAGVALLRRAAGVAVLRVFGVILPGSLVAKALLGSRVTTGMGVGASAISAFPSVTP